MDFSKYYFRRTVGGNLNTVRTLHASHSCNRRKGIIHPHGYSFDWAVKAFIPNIDIYTHEPLPRVRTGGRGPNGNLNLLFSFKSGNIFTNRMNLILPSFHFPHFYFKLKCNKIDFNSLILTASCYYMFFGIGFCIKIELTEHTRNM